LRIQEKIWAVKASRSATRCCANELQFARQNSQRDEQNTVVGCRFAAGKHSESTSI